MGGLFSSNNDEPEYKTSPYTNYEREYYTNSEYQNIRDNYNRNQTGYSTSSMRSSTLSTNSEYRNQGGYSTSSTLNRSETTNPPFQRGYRSTTQSEYRGGTIGRPGYSTSSVRSSTLSTNSEYRNQSGYSTSSTLNRSETTNPPFQQEYRGTIQSEYRGGTIDRPRTVQRSATMRNASYVDPATLRLAESLCVIRDQEPSIDSFLLGLEAKLGRRIQGKSLYDTYSRPQSCTSSRMKTENSLHSKNFYSLREEVPSKIELITKNNIFNKISPFENDEIEMIRCNEDSEIFRQVCNNQKAFFRPKRTLTILSVHLVDNIYLKTLYQLKKADLENIHGKCVVERKMYHSATDEKIRAICAQNFNYRLSGKNRGHKYGHGISFSPKFAYANYFSDKHSAVKTMLQCKVLFVKAHVGDNDTLVPDEGYDSTMRENGKVLVKYDDDVFLPQYLIKYMLT